MSRRPGDVSVRPLSPFGAQVDLDLNDPTMADPIRVLFNRYGLLVFRDQAVPVERHKRIMGYLGHVREQRPDFPHPPDHGGNNLLGSSVHALDVAFETTSARYTNGVAALRNLPVGLRDRIECLRGVGASSVGEPGYPHPLVITDPTSGEQALSADGLQAGAIAGLESAESAALLGELRSHADAPEHVYVHDWRDGDVVMWSNVRVHYAPGAGTAEMTSQRFSVTDRSSVLGDLSRTNTSANAGACPLRRTPS